jgi:predicted transcriptional regulator
MKTTLEMPDDLFRRVKTTAAKRGQSLKQLVTTALEHELANPSRPAASAKARDAHAKAWLSEFDKLSGQISTRWNSDMSAVDAIREQRREL